MAKRTAKNNVFLDLFQNKSYLLKLYKTLYPEDTTSTEDSLTDVTITNVLTDNLYNDLGFIDKTAWNDTKGSYGNDSHMQGQECFKGIFSAERKGGCDDYDEFI